MGDNSAISTSIPSSIADRSWLHFCGGSLDGEVDNPIKIFYGELFSDAALVIAPATMAPLLLKQRGFVDFALIYFSLVNGWFLYVHHFKARFQEQSRVHSILQWVFIVSLVGGVRSCWDLAQSSDMTEGQRTALYQNFSIFMGLLRLSLFLMFLRVAVHVWQAASLCLLIIFFLANSCLCFVLAAISEIHSIVILWTIGAIMETLMDLVVTTCLRRRSQIPVALASTFDQFWAVILAPLGSISVTSFLHNFPTTQGNNGAFDPFFHGSAVLLMALFGLLYYHLKKAVSHRLSTCHRCLQTIGLFHMKLVGLSLWTVGANICILLKLLETIETDPQDVRHHSDLLALSVMFAFVLFFVWKSCNGHPYDWGEIMWILLINGAFVCGTMLSSSKGSHLWLLILDVVLVAALNAVEIAGSRRERPWLAVGRRESITTTVSIPFNHQGSHRQTTPSTEQDMLLPVDETTGNISQQSNYVSVTPVIQP